MGGGGDVAERLRAKGWRQGSVVPASACERLALLKPDSAALAVVASQDCDVVADEDVESHVELIAATLVTEPDNGTLYGKQPRYLTLPLVNSTRYLELSIRHRTLVPKAHLAEFQPDPSSALSNADVRTMANWLGKRYTRDAFPDAFNRRIQPARHRLEKLSKSEKGKPVARILVQIEGENVEREDNDPYRIALWFVFRDDYKNSDSRRAMAESFAAEYVVALRACHGIEVPDDPEVRSLGEVTLEDAELLMRFDYDYRSVAPKPGGDTC